MRTGLQACPKFAYYEFFFFDKNIEPARDLLLVARFLPLVGTSSLPPATGRL